MENKKKNIYKVGQMFYSPKRDNFFVIKDYEFIDLKQDILYNVEYPTASEADRFKRYYQGRMGEFQEVTNLKQKRAVKAIYGAKHV